MVFAIKVDEDLPRAAVDLLCRYNYDAISVIDQQMGGWKDPLLWKAVQDENRFLVTADKGFANAQKYPPGNHAGILLLRPDEDGISPIIVLLKKVLDSYKLPALSGSITVATPRSIRTRKS
jgi:predicted nuclease of predicted toxin-antitoxin system